MAQSKVGADILLRIRDIMVLAEADAMGMSYPGEGGERPFRGWLQNMLLVSLLKWPTERVRIGERFDIIMTDAHGYPVATIETKAPGHTATPQERETFEARLSDFATLQVAFLTDGYVWERLDLYAPTGIVTIRDRHHLRLESATPDEAESFFAPLMAARYLGQSHRMGRMSPTRDNPYALEALSQDLRSAVSNLAGVLDGIHRGIMEGLAGSASAEVSNALFQLWCEESNIEPPAEVAAKMTSSLGSPTSAHDVRGMLAELGFVDSVEDVASELSRLSRGALPPRHDETAAAISALYRDARAKLMAQTAHVIVGRALLYRVGEDKKVFPRTLSGDEMAARQLGLNQTSLLHSAPALDALLDVRSKMQAFLPAVYKLGEFDWWLVTDEKRQALSPNELAWVLQRDSALDICLANMLDSFNAYYFSSVDIDVWRNVYQHYLPSEERQRIGGFYTPDELVRLVLDLSDFRPECEGLCKLSFIDPACGSGAFVAAAVSRLLDHLDRDLPCHAHLNKPRTPQWQRAAQVLAIVQANTHAIDIHPFAAFLTTINVLFLVLHLYAKARENSPSITLDLDVFSHDSLELAPHELLQPELMGRLNSRIQLTENSMKHYEAILAVKFDRVFGNPPWGGILKGPLAPVYDEARKVRLKQAFPATATGKYDIYGLFIERATQVLKPGGRFGFVTQDTFIDKSWAKGLRQLLYSKTRLRWIASLNPFGQLYFNAMNTPCITVADLGEPAGDYQLRVLQAKSTGAAALARVHDRRAYVADGYTDVAARLEDGDVSAETQIAFGHTLLASKVCASSADRWLLDPGEVYVRAADTVGALDLLSPSQGVTTGGEGVLERLTLNGIEAVHLGLEKDTYRFVARGRELARWATSQGSQVLVYPYVRLMGEYRPAFTIDTSTVDEALARELHRSGVTDALDFDRQIDDYERDLWRTTDRATLPARLLAHRVDLGLVAYPSLASFLVAHYDALEGRTLEKQNIRKFNRQWYEYHRPRDTALMLSEMKLLTPRLCREPRFSMDTLGLLPQDSCVAIAPKLGSLEWRKLLVGLSAALGTPATTREGLLYCLAFLNSDLARRELRSGQPTPKGSYTIGDAFLGRIPIPSPSKDAARIVSLADELVRGAGDRISGVEDNLGKLTSAAVKS